MKLTNKKHILPPANKMDVLSEKEPINQNN